MRCVRCESTNIVRLPENDYSPHPGFRCSDCGYRMRGKGFGLVVLYLIGMLMGGVFVAFGVWMFLMNEKPKLDAALGGALVGLFAFSYSLFQLLKPTPLDDVSSDE